jgi:hypothetical protein
VILGSKETIQVISISSTSLISKEEVPSVPSMRHSLSKSDDDYTFNVVGAVLVFTHSNSFRPPQQGCCIPCDIIKVDDGKDFVLPSNKRYAFDC